MNPERTGSAPPRGPTGGWIPAGPVTPPDRPFPIGGFLAIALLSGVLMGVSLALLSIFVPGALPVLSPG